LLTDCALAISAVSNPARRTMETWSVFTAMLPSGFTNIINILNCRRARKDAVLARVLYRRKVGAHGQHTDDGAPVLAPRPAQGRMLGFAERHPLALGRAQQVP
jgi:hypothetical protein